ncbi:MAG: class I SAM-dependent methyltransferase [Actinomycetota bacterium]
MSAAVDWAENLASWAIPQEILDAAPADPWEYHVDHFARVADRPPDLSSPSYLRAMEGLPDGGTVLDIGCGAGAASLPLAHRAGRLIGLDESEGMLAAFAERARVAGVAHAEVQGRWPDARADVAAVDVVVSHHVLYNVRDIEPFVAALADHAGRRFVVEITAEHPRATENPLWRALHGIERPTRPTADDAVAVMRDLGLEVGVERWRKAMVQADLPREDLIKIVRVELCLPPERDPEIAKVLEEHPPPQDREVVTLWWDRV